MFTLRHGEKSLNLELPKVMGILNVTPDSFSDGGQFAAFESACRHADEMVALGVDIIDIGGESTRPGAADVTLAEELKRVIPIIEYISAKHDVWISIDTSKAEVMEKAVKAGANLINDVRALQEPGALAMAAKLNVPVCLMHMQGQPRSMQLSPHYNDIISDISAFLQERVAACIDAGIEKDSIILDPGFGFGKTLENNYQLLRRLEEFQPLGLPILIGLSRKSMFGQLLEREADERVPASLAGALIGVQHGAHIVRVHDVAPTQDVLQVWQATNSF